MNEKYWWYKEIPKDLLANPLYSGASALQYGAIMRLRHSSWLEDNAGYLWNNEESLRRIAKMEKEEWDENREVILRAFSKTSDKSQIFDPGLAKAYFQNTQVSTERSKAGKAGASARAKGKGSKIPMEALEILQIWIQYRNENPETSELNKDGTLSRNGRGVKALVQVQKESGLPWETLRQGAIDYLQELDNPEYIKQFANFWEYREYEAYCGVY